MRFYFDEHMPRPVARALEQKGHEVVMAVDVNMTSKDDDTEHLPFARENHAIMVTRDKPFAGRIAKRTDHAGLICWTGEQDDFGGMIRILNKFAENYSFHDVQGQVFWLKS